MANKEEEHELIKKMRENKINPPTPEYYTCINVETEMGLKLYKKLLKRMEGYEKEGFRNPTRAEPEGLADAGGCGIAHPDLIR